MSLMICGKCESESTYFQGGGYACMMCGNRSPSRYGFHRKGEPPEPIEEYEEPVLEDEEIEQEEEIGMGKKRTPEQRERIAAGIRAAKERKAASGGGQSKVEKKPKPGAAKKQPVLTKDDLAFENSRPLPRFANLPDPSDVELKLTPDTPIRKLIAHGDLSVNFIDPGHVLLDFTLEENKHLLEPWKKYARSHRRGPGDQAMMLIEELVTNEGLI